MAQDYVQAIIPTAKAQFFRIITIYSKNMDMKLQTLEFYDFFYHEEEDLCED